MFFGYHSGGKNFFQIGQELFSVDLPDVLKKYGKCPYDNETLAVMIRSGDELPHPAL